jgi:hypothetical protein
MQPRPIRQLGRDGIVGLTRRDNKVRGGRFLRAEEKMKEKLTRNLETIFAKDAPRGLAEMMKARMG